ncbi:MAG TPA: hypothetical protein VGK73_01430, partial [Polyangiaceae bacterium]
DPYARITVAGTESDRLFAIEENRRAHRMQSEDATLQRIAASRKGKLEQTVKDIDRPIAPSSMASSRGVVFGPLGEKQFHRSARRYWKRAEGHPVTWPEGSYDDV